MNTFLSSAYWPNLQYFYYLLNGEEVIVEQQEHYQKQSYRNRTQILGANGVLNLIIPVVHQGNKMLMKDVEIDYNENWHIKHWRAITSAYKNSPYFEFFENEFYYLYQEKEKYLIQFNLKQIELILKIFKMKKSIKLSDTFELHYSNAVDKRFVIHPKINFKDDEGLSIDLKKRYYQTFGSKFEFEPNLSILDLLFNKGMEAKEYLHLHQNDLTQY
jgi:hypothetical protein